MSKLETNTIDTISGTANLTIGGANNTGSTTIKTNDTDAVTIDNSQNLKFNSGYGSVSTAYGVRAWVSFAGTSTIDASGNVSSITDHGTGDYTITFTNPMPDVNYVVSFLSGNNGATSNGRAANFNSARTVNGFRTHVVQVTNAAAVYVDDQQIGFMVVR